MIQAPARRTDTKQQRSPAQAARGLLLLVLALMAIAPLANIVVIIATTGADNLSNDYLAYTGLVQDVLAGGYDWSHYFRDTFYRTHSVALPVFLHILDACIFHWSIYPELYLGIALAAARVLLLYRTFSSSAENWTRWCILPALSLLVFSTSQISVYTFGDAALTIGLSLSGFALGFWGLACGGQRAPGLLAMLAGGLIASFSWGNGLVSWLVFLAALPLLGYRKPWHYAVWFFGFSLSVLPYLLFLSPPGASHAAEGIAGRTVVSLFNWRFVVNALGWPFSNNIALHSESLPEARTIGWTGLALAFTGLVLLWRLRSRDLWQKSTPALLLMAHGLLSLWQISVFRSLIAAWYTAVAMSFWIGLCALGITVLQDRSAATRTAHLLKVWSGLVLVFTAGIYIRSNLTYEDKTDFLFSRSPASASALRNYRSAPTYGEGLLFQWGSGNPGLLERLALPLEQHQLSAFAPQQQWTLQGDFLLDRVKVTEQPNAPDVIWTSSTREADRLPWYHYKHLNVLIAAPNVVTWTVALPSDLQTAEFQSAVAISKSAPKTATAGGAWCKIDIRSERGDNWLSFAKPVSAKESKWQPLKIDLSPYKGQLVTIRLSALIGRNKDANWLVYEYPHIDLVRHSAQPAIAARLRLGNPSLLAPSNTDLSTQFPAKTANDFVITLDGNEQPSIQASASELDLDLSQYSYMWLELAAPANIKPRTLIVDLKLSGKTEPLRVQIPLLPDGNLHSYTYDLKLLELDRSEHLSGISIEPLPASTTNDGNTAQISEMRFIGKQGHFPGLSPKSKLPPCDVR